MIALMMLTALLVYALIALLATRLLAHIPKKRTTRWAVALLVLAVFALIPTWDIVPGRLFFAHLCETEGGLAVYKVVEFPTDWDGHGRAPYLDDRGFFDADYLNNRYKLGRVSKKISPSFLNIKKRTDYIVDIYTGKRVGQYSYFIYKGGWLINSTGAHVSGTLCRAYPRGSVEDFFEHIFVPVAATTTQNGDAL